MAQIPSNAVPFQVLSDETEESRYGLELGIFAFDNPMNLLDVVPRRTGLKVLDEIGGPGGGSFTIPRHDEKILDTPNLLDYHNVCKVSCDGVIVGAFLIQDLKSVYVSDDEASGEIWQVSGSGLRTWFKNAVVYPSKGLKNDSQSSRSFSFASERGDWYVESDWSNSVSVQQYNMDPNPLPFGTAPAEWPDAPEAHWIWGVANDANSDPAPGGMNFFRHEFEIDPSIGTGPYSFFASGKDEFDVYLDGQVIIESRETNGYAQTWRADFQLGPGAHILAARVRANGGAQAGFIGAFYRVGDASRGISAELLSVTHPTTWVVNAYPDPAPGWTPGEIMLTLLAEAEERGVRFPGFLTPTFTSTLDSDGALWERALDWSFDIGTEYFDVIEMLEELVCDVWIDPASLELNMYATRGVHRDVQSPAVQPVKLEVGRNVVRADEEGKSDIKNALVMSTNDGWSATSDGMTDSLEKYGRMEGYVSTGASASVSGDLAQSVFQQRAEPEQTATYSIVDVDDARPFRNFDTGDWVLAPSSENEAELTPRRVMSISVAEDDTTGAPQFALEFDTIYQDATARYDRWLRKTGDGTLGGTLSNVSVGGGGGKGTPTTQTVQRGPQGLEGQRGLPGFAYLGVWSAGTYQVSDVVFYNNKFWVADGQTTETPSPSAVHWDELTVTPSTPPSSGITVYLAANYDAPIAATAIPWTGERFKSGVTHAANSSDLVIQDSGPYFISGSIQSTLGSSSQAREFQVQVNGVVVASAKSSPSSSSSTTAFADLPGVFLNLATGDVVRLVSSGTAIHVIPTGTTAWFSLAKVSGVQGPAGPTGPAGAIASATATALAAGAAPTVTLGGTPQARTMEFGIPAGAKGDKGNTGDAGKISSATAIALAPGATPTVTLGGTAQDRTMEFGIPAGAQGVQGVPGAPLNFRGAWSSSTTYAPSDAVSYGGSLWVSSATNTNKTPGVASEWTEYASGGWQRTTASVTTASLATGALSKTTIALARSYRLFKITTDKAARVRIYATAVQQTADEARAIGVDPSGDHGLIFEFVTTSLLLSSVLSPFVDGASMETTPSANIPITITNLSGATGTVKVDLTFVRTE